MLVDRSAMDPELEARFDRLKRYFEEPDDDGLVLRALHLLDIAQHAAESGCSLAIIDADGLTVATVSPS